MNVFTRHGLREGKNAVIQKRWNVCTMRSDDQCGPVSFGGPNGDLCGEKRGRARTEKEKELRRVRFYFLHL